MGVLLLLSSLLSSSLSELVPDDDDEQIVVWEWLLLPTQSRRPLHLVLHRILGDLVKLGLLWTVLPRCIGLFFFLLPSSSRVVVVVVK